MSDYPLAASGTLESHAMKETLALLEKVRGHYLEGYRSALAKFIEQNHPSAPEVLFPNNPG